MVITNNITVILTLINPSYWFAKQHVFQYNICCANSFRSSSDLQPYYFRFFEWFIWRKSKNCAFRQEYTNCKQMHSNGRHFGPKCVRINKHTIHKFIDAKMRSHCQRHKTLGSNQKEHPHTHNQIKRLSQKTIRIVTQLVHNFDQNNICCWKNVK